MSGPSNKDRAGLGRLLERREFWSEVFGWLVGAGLLIEYGREIIDCFVRWHPPSMELVGGLLVTAGVFGEVWFSHLVANAARSLSDLADSDVAQANDRSAQALARASQAEQATAEANLARVKLETELRRRTVSRTLSKDEGDSFVNSLKQFSGQRFATYWGDLGGSPSKVAEKLSFVTQLRELFIEAGWEEEQQAQLPPKLDTPDAVTA